MTRLAETTAASPLPVTVVKGLKLVAALGATGVIFRMKRRGEREREREKVDWISSERSSFLGYGLGPKFWVANPLSEAQPLVARLASSSVILYRCVFKTAFPDGSTYGKYPTDCRH
ncbi:MAG: hypothetical protein KatS3mg130_1861 [Candidatus Sumerlaea sp.]|nr:MAG: hypothetical protein KatS3mg130_1861 [Candidatus Sumerlaea sp.]